MTAARSGIEQSDWRKSIRCSKSSDSAANRDAATTSESGLVSRAPPVQTAVRNCMRDEGGPFGFGDQVLIPSHRKLLRSRAVVVSVAEKSGQ